MGLAIKEYGSGQTENCTYRSRSDRDARASTEVARFEETNSATIGASAPPAPRRHHARSTRVNPAPHAHDAGRREISERARREFGKARVCPARRRSWTAP